MPITLTSIKDVTNIDDAIPGLVGRATLANLIEQLSLEKTEELTIQGKVARGVWNNDHAELWVLSKRNGFMKVKHLEYRTAKEKLGKAFKAFGRAAVAVAKGQNLAVSPEVYEQRKAVCVSCKSYNDVEDKCSECGCRAIAAKLKLTTERCPIDLW